MQLQQHLDSNILIVKKYILIIIQFAFNITDIMSLNVNILQIQGKKGISISMNYEISSSCYNVIVNMNGNIFTTKKAFV